MNQNYVHPTTFTAHPPVLNLTKIRLLVSAMKYADRRIDGHITPPNYVLGSKNA